MAHIASYRFKRIDIDGKIFTKDVIILPAEIIHPWWRESSHQVLVQDLTKYIEGFPRTLIIGTGKYGMMHLENDTEQWLKEQGIDAITMKTDEACKQYNESDHSKTGAALHLTC